MHRKRSRHVHTTFNKVMQLSQCRRINTNLGKTDVEESRRKRHNLKVGVGVLLGLGGAVPKGTSASGFLSLSRFGGTTFTETSGPLELNCSWETSLP